MNLLEASQTWRNCMASFTGTGYIPLPSNVHIKDSSIHGQGLFAKEDISKDTELGESHVFLMLNFDGDTREWERKEWLRTPLGAFINHSDTPNAIVEIRYNTAFLIVISDVKAGEEITVTYDEEAFLQLGL